MESVKEVRLVIILLLALVIAIGVALGVVVLDYVYSPISTSCKKVIFQDKNATMLKEECVKQRMNVGR